MKWNIDPELIRIGPIALRYYGLMFVIGFYSMGIYVTKLFKEEGKNAEDISTLSNYLIAGMLIGARIGHCLFYDPSYYFQHPQEIIYVWEGGLASHGGYAGVIVAVLLFLKKHPSYKFLTLMDMIAGPCLFVGGLIRIGNFMNSEIYGKPTNLPWAVVFERVDIIPRHPSQIYEAIGYFSIALLLAYLYKSKFKSWGSGKLLAIAIIISTSFRFLVEFTKDEQSTVSDISLFNMGQWLSIFFVLLGFALFFYANKQKPRMSEVIK